MLEDELREGETESECAPGSSPETPSGSAKAAREQHEVLKVFGVKLTVYNPRLAELLTMEAKEALTKDVGDLVKSAGGEQGVTWDSETAAGAPSAEEISTDAGMIATIGDAGSRLGFDVAGHSWRSPLGVTIITKPVSGPADLGQAEEAVSALATSLEEAGGEQGGLVVAEDQLLCDTFRLAVRKQNLYPKMRVISLQNLEHLLALFEGGTLTHRQVVLLLVPLANIDVGELLNVLQASGDQMLGGA